MERFGKTALKLGQRQTAAIEVGSTLRNDIVTISDFLLTAARQLYAPVFFGLMFFICGGSVNAEVADAAAAEKYPAKIIIDTSIKVPVNRSLLGSNTQWIDRGDEILSGETSRPVPETLVKLKKLGITTLRYPGGSNADLYHWKDGIGPIEERKSNLRFHGGGGDKIIFGTAEFLSLCKELGAEPIITVNMITGTAEDAAEWVRQTNITRMKDQDMILPKVKYWEIGNEPYLIDDGQKDLAIAPDVFAERVNSFVRAMKAVDQDILVGLPMRSDTLAGVPATPLQGYNKAVLNGVKEAIDFVSIHEAYYPFIYSDVPDENSIYLSTMAASDIVEENFSQTRSQLKEHRKEKFIPIALTEYNAWYTLGGKKSDGYIASFMGAIYIADLFVKLGNMNDLLMANHWSLSGNWYFGAIDNAGKIRPSYSVLEGFSRFWVGDRLQTKVDTIMFNSPAVGFAPARQGIPWLSAISVERNGLFQIWVVNKHASAYAQVSLEIIGRNNPSSVNISTLSTSDVFATTIPAADLQWSELNQKDITQDPSFMLPPHSISIIKFDKSGEMPPPANFTVLP